MRSILFVSAISLGGCAAHMAPAPTTPPPAQVASDVSPSEEQETARIRELRAELALANARSAELEMQSARDTVTLGTDRPPESEEGLFSAEGDWDQPAERLPPAETASETPEDRDRPVLRLYGLPQAPPISAQGLPSLPYASAPYRPVTTAPPVPPTSVVPSNDHLPWENASAIAAATPQPTVAAPERVELGLESYRGALGMLRSRRFAESLVAFERFEQTHPNHPQVANARYWRAELYYIQRQYGQARTAFESYVGRYPRGRRVADALLKLSLCFRRLGNEREATAHMDRLRREFPSSEAARLASREVNR
ncbi:MAG: tol-pal system protein YbgF [Polyangiales bacterium]|jgi:tol-pal system protein YbgF